MNLKGMKWNGWLARDKNGDLYFYEDKPERGRKNWFPILRKDGTIGVYFLLTKRLNFDVSDLTFKDEPVKAVITFSLKEDMERKKIIEVALKILSYLIAAFLGGAGTAALL